MELIETVQGSLLYFSPASSSILQGYTLTHVKIHVFNNTASYCLHITRLSKMG